jgi:hypothetical protein
MARIAVCAPGVNLLGEFQNGGGTWSVQTATTFAKCGRSALRINPTTTAVGWVAVGGPQANGLISNYNAGGTTTLFHQFYFKYATKPASNWEEIASVQANANAYVLIIGLNSSGNIVVYDSTAALVATGTTALSANTEYCIEVKGAKGATAAYEVRINGTSELSGTCNQGTSNLQMFGLGKKTDRNSNTVDFFYAGIVVDDAVYPGGSYVTQLVPRANGSTMQWTSGTAPSDYTTVDECPISVADYVMGPTTANKLALFVFDSCATAGITGVIKAVCAMCAGVRENVTVTSNGTMRVKSGSTNSDIAVGNITTGDRIAAQLLLTDPATGAAWSIAGVDAVEAGYLEANAVSIRMAQVFLAVEYTVQDTKPFFALAA